MNDIDLVLDTLRRMGKSVAEAVQVKSSTMTGTELNAEDDYIPSFVSACRTKNMLERKAGLTDGFVCKSSAGRVVRLLQNYDSDIYFDEPEQLPAQWGFVWSNDPAKAKPFISSSTSPYMEGNCCTENGIAFRSKINYNVWPPSAYPQGWEQVTTEEEL